MIASLLEAPATNPKTQQSHKSDDKNIPENGPIRESLGIGTIENTRESTRPADGSKPLFRESFSKPPRKLPNTSRRSREFLTPDEVDRLQKGAERIGRHGHRDGALILLAHRH